MEKHNVFCISILSSTLALSGCVVRTYTMTRQRVDQDLVGGNRGYIMGKAPANIETKEKKPTRTTEVVEIELHSPIKFEKKHAPEVGQPQGIEEQPAAKESMPIEVNTASPEQNIQKYTVQKNDTLQKISQKLYGTTKKWTKIFDLNREVLKAPDKIYPGQVINVPAPEEQSKSGAAIKQTEENLK